MNHFQESIWVACPSTTKSCAGMGPDRYTVDSYADRPSPRVPTTKNTGKQVCPCHSRLRPIAIALFIVGWVTPCSNTVASPFASAVVEYRPAPGQFVNHASFNNPAKALGAPIGAGLSAADNTSVVTLGGFGGSITLTFDDPVCDHPLNPFGMDAIVFGNAFYSGSNPNRHWAECATIEISRDDNENGLADDRWYLIAGSHNPSNDWLTLTWDDDIADSTYPPELASLIPSGQSGVWTTQGFELPSKLFGSPVVVNPSPNANVEGIFGYAEYSPTVILGDLTGNNIVDDPTLLPEQFYVIPDDPHATGITHGSGGGDAFDIAWAIDPATGEDAELDEFHFIRITTAVNATSIVTGETSAEIDAVSDVAPDFFGDVDEDSDIDMADVAELQVCFDPDMSAVPECATLDRRSDAFVDLLDSIDVLSRLTGPLIAE